MSSGAALLMAVLTFELSVRPYYFDEAGAKRGYLRGHGWPCYSEVRPNVRNR